MTSTMIPLPSAGTAFAGATSVRRPGDVGPVADEQSFADRFDRALTDARTRKDRSDSTDSTDEAGRSEPSHADDRIGEVRREPSRLDKNDTVDGHQIEGTPVVTDEVSSDVEVELGDQTDSGGDATNQIAGSIAAALDLTNQSEVADVQVGSAFLGGSETETAEPDIAVPVPGSAHPKDLDIGSGDKALSGGLNDEIGAVSLDQNQTTLVSAQSDLSSGTHSDETSVDVAPQPSTPPARNQLDALNLDNEVQLSLAATSNGDDPVAEDPTAEADKHLEALSAVPDESAPGRPPAGERSVASGEMQASTSSVVAASISAETSSMSSTVAETHTVGTGPVEVATDTNSTTPIDLGPNLVSVSGNATPPPSPVSTSPLPATQQQAIMEAAISRIADTVEALSKQPPPRAISLDFGEAHGIRVRIAIDAGGINVTVADAGAGTSDTATWQRQLSDSFDQQQRNRDSEQTPTDDNAGSDTDRTSTRQNRQDAGLRL